MKYFLLLLLLFFPLWVWADAFNQPWLNTDRPLILDPYFQNSIHWDDLQKEKRVLAIIHKASQGFKIDPSYLHRKKEAVKRGYLWGSYHLGTSADPLAQADHYLNVVKPKKDELIALDLENLDDARYMNLEQAEQFIARIYEKTGRYPMIYANHKVVSVISTKKNFGSIFSKTPLWYARFVPQIKNFPTSIWPTYTLWQFSSEIKVQYTIPGTLADMDINVFNGSAEQLRKQWPF